MNTLNNAQIIEINKIYFKLIKCKILCQNVYGNMQGDFSFSWVFCTVLHTHTSFQNSAVSFWCLTNPATFSIPIVAVNILDVITYFALNMLICSKVVLYVFTVSVFVAQIAYI